MTITLKAEKHGPLPFPPARVWALLGQTDWLQRSLGLPPVEHELRPRMEGGSALSGMTRWRGRRWHWQEDANEWLEPHTYRMHRAFYGNLLTEARLDFETRLVEPESCFLKATVELTCQKRLATWLARRWLRAAVQRKLEQLFPLLTYALTDSPPGVLPRVPASRINEAFLAERLAMLRQVGQPEELIQRLESLLRHGADAQLLRLHPLALARAWQIEPWSVARLFLQAARCGLVELRWTVVCPRCRRACAPPELHLPEVREPASCARCNTQFDLEVDRLVTLTFRPAAPVRPLDERVYCDDSPAESAQVLSQIVLAPRQRRAWRTPPLSEPLRLCSPQVKEAVSLEPEDGPAPLFQSVILCELDRFKVKQEFGKADPYSVLIFNPNPFPVQVRLERARWDPDVLTALRVLFWPEFRRQCPGEILQPGYRFAIGAYWVLCVSFSGIADGTSRDDPAAQRATLGEYLAWLQPFVDNAHGQWLSTQADPCIAAFGHSADAFAALGALFEAVAAEPGTVGTVVKTALHVGRCWVTQQEDRLEYSAAPLLPATRLLDFAQGRELILSQAAHETPEAKAFLAAYGKTATAIATTASGEETTTPVWRVGG